MSLKRYYLDLSTGVLDFSKFTVKIPSTFPIQTINETDTNLYDPVYVASAAVIDGHYLSITVDSDLSEKALEFIKIYPIFAPLTTQAHQLHFDDVSGITQIIGFKVVSKDHD